MLEPSRKVIWASTQCPCPFLGPNALALQSGPFFRNPKPLVQGHVTPRAQGQGALYVGVILGVEAEPVLAAAQVAAGREAEEALPPKPGR